MYDLRKPLLSVGVLQQKVLSYSLHVNESLSFKGSIILNQLPDQYKAAKTDHEFKMKIKCWKGFECTCRICI